MAPFQLEELLASLLTRRQQHGRLRNLTTVPAGAVDFSSNAYLSLSSNTEVLQAYLAEIRFFVEPGNPPAAPLLGSGGSRLLDGNSAFSVLLERDIARFHGTPTSLLFNSAMDANIGLFSSVPQPGDVIVYDELIHASIHDGMRMSRAAKTLPFTHNHVFSGNISVHATSGAKSLEAVLYDLQHGIDGHAVSEGTKNVFIAVEGVYSMDGDVAPLQDVVACVARMLPKRNGYIVVDEAHSVGLFGKQGRGLVCHLGLEDQVWARVHGFGKALGCAGGVVLCSHTTRLYLINYARTLIYTTAMALNSLVSIKVAYGFLMDGRADNLIAQLHDIVQHTHKVLLSVCSRCHPPVELLYVNSDSPKSPIIPLLTSHPRCLASHCQAMGFMVRPIVAPTVPKGKERVRICLHANNTADQVDRLGAVIESWLLLKKHQLSANNQGGLERQTSGKKSKL